MNNRTSLFVILVVSMIIAAQASEPCKLSTLRKPTGIALECECPGRFTSLIPSETSVGVETDCLDSCMTSEAVKSACKSANIQTFQSATTTARDSCCSSCGGDFKEFKCRRVILEGRPLTLPVDSGCIYKVRATSIGHAYTCKCADGKNFEVPFFIASGLNEACLRQCGNRKVRNQCENDKSESMIRKQNVVGFEVCCNVCGGVVLNGGYTCGFDLE